MVDRGRREHDPEHRIAWGDECRDGCVGSGAEQHDRPGRCEQLGGLGVAHLGKAAGVVEVRDHDGERLVGPVLALPETLDRAVVGRVAGEVVATETLDGDGPTRSGSSPGPPGAGRHRRSPTSSARSGAVAEHRPAVVDSRSAGRGNGGRSGRGTRRAGIAHVECRHRGVRPVVGEVADDREPWPAVRAGDEGVAVTPVVRVVHLGDAVVADRRVGRDQRAGAGRAATVDDPETWFAGGSAR